MKAGGGASPGNRWVGPLIGLVAVALGGFLLYRALSGYDGAKIAAAVMAISWQSLGGAVLFAGLSYLCLSGFDVLALRYVKRPLSYGRTALASFTALSIGHNIGFAGLSSGAIRYRFYRRWGLSLEQIAKLIVFCGLTVGLGLATVAGVALIVSPKLASRFVGGEGAVMLLGAGLLFAVAIYLALSIWMTKPFVLWRWSVEIPPPKLACAQVAIGSLNYLCVAGCLHQLVTSANDVGYFSVAGAYVLSNVAAIASHVPGGAGVIETVLTALFPGIQLIGVLVMFRVIYYLLPLAIGLPLFGLSELCLRENAPKPPSQA